MRYLGADAFGYVSLALFFASLLSHLSTLGLDSALVQRPSLKRKTLSTHLMLRVTLGVAVLLLVVAFAPLLRSLYAGQAVVVDVLLVLALANLLSASFSTPSALLRRDLRFGALAVLNLLSSLIITVGAPLMAFLGAGVWSLVFEAAMGHLVRWAGIWLIVRPWRPALGFDWAEAKSLLGFGRHVLLSQFLVVVLGRFDDFWAGTSLGASALGIYSRAYEIAGYPARVLATPVTHVFYSTFSALQDNRSELSKAVAVSSSFLVRAGFWVGVVLLIVIPEATSVLLGESWLPIVPVFRLMTVYVVLDPLYLNLSRLIIGLGHPRILVRIRLGQVALFVAAVVAFSHWWSIQGIAIAANLMMLTGVVALLMYSARYVRLELTRMLGWPLCALLVASALGVALSFGVTWPGLWAALMVKTLGVSLSFALVLFLGERRTLLEYGGWLRKAIGPSACWVRPYGVGRKSSALRTRSGADGENGERMDLV
jgi:O-antigen/teichoic acid export membrane protein